jgi:hypothetical protein
MTDLQFTQVEPTGAGSGDVMFQTLGCLLTNASSLTVPGQLSENMNAMVEEIWSYHFRQCFFPTILVCVEAASLKLGKT